MITSQNRPGLPVFLRATLKKLGKAWVRGYIFLRDNHYPLQDGYTPLFEACLNMQVEIAVLLLSAGAIADIQTSVSSYTLIKYHDNQTCQTHDLTVDQY